jgi:hypothetical protein
MCIHFRIFNVDLYVTIVICIIRPDLIEYNKLTKANPTYNLNNAFNVAENKLGLTRLLDPEGQSAASSNCTAFLEFQTFQ